MSVQLLLLSTAAGEASDALVAGDMFLPCLQPLTQTYQRPRPAKRSQRLTPDDGRLSNGVLAALGAAFRKGPCLSITTGTQLHFKLNGNTDASTWPQDRGTRHQVLVSSAGKVSGVGKTSSMAYTADDFRESNAS